MRKRFSNCDGSEKKLKKKQGKSFNEVLMTESNDDKTNQIL